MDYMAPLTSEEWLHFNALMEDQGGMQLPKLHGYLTAIMTGPTPLRPEKWMPWIWKDARDTEEAPPGFQESIDMIGRLCDGITTQFEGEGAFIPLLSSEGKAYDHLQCDKAALEQWCRGYLEGMQVAQPLKLHQGDDRLAVFYTPLLVLASDDQAVEQHLGKALKDITLEELRIVSAEILPEAIADIYNYWREWGEKNSLFQQQAFPKIGRNDLCPCGSGKKYKKCCWQKMMN